MGRRVIKNVFRMWQNRRNMALVILILLLVPAGSSCSIFGSTTLPEGPTLERTIPKSMEYPGILDESDRDIQFYRNVYAWEDYTDAVIHKEEFQIESPNGLAPWIQAIDDDLNAFVLFGGLDMNQRGLLRVDGTYVDEMDRLKSPSDDSEPDPTLDVAYFPLVEYQIETGTQKELIRLDPYMYPYLLAVSDKYLVWTEKSVIQRSGAMMESRQITGEKVLHLYIRATGEDIPVTTPTLEQRAWTDSGPYPPKRMVLRDDSLYFDTYTSSSGRDADDTDYSLFRFDILSRSLTSFGEAMYNPVQYKERIAWLEAGKVEDHLTLLFEDDVDRGESDPLVVSVPELDGIEHLFRSFGVTDNCIYIGDRDQDNHDGGIRMIDEKGKQIPILAFRHPGNDLVANLIHGYAGITLYDDGYGMYLYDPEKSILVRMDGIPNDVVPLMNGQDVVNLSGQIHKSVLVDTTKMMYLSPDGLPAHTQGPYTLVWFDVADLN